MSDQAATVCPPESQRQPASTSISNTGNAATSQTTTANQPARSQTSGPHSTITVTVGPSTAPPSTAPASEGVESGQTSGDGDESENFPDTQRPDMAVTQVRINTFVGWPHNASHPKEEMAEAGFYYTGHTDHVVCFRCNGGLRNWERFDRPWIEHSRWFPCCPFIKMRKGQKFVQAVQKLKDQDTTPMITEDDVLKEMKRMKEEERRCNGSQLALRGPSMVAVDTHEQPSGESPEHVEHPERMSSPKGRLQSFSGLRDEEGGTRIDKLAEAGFYYDGTAVKCFSCGGTISKWSSGDSPWIEHGRLYPQCKFLIKKKGQTFVDAVQNICKPFPVPETARRNQTAIGQTAVQEGGLPCNTAQRSEPNTQRQKRDHIVSRSDAQGSHQSSAHSEVVYGGRSAAMGQQLVHETPLPSLAPAEALPLRAASQDNGQAQVENKDRQDLCATAKGSASNLSHPRRPIQETHEAEATPIISDAEISVSPASQVQATYSWSEGQEIAQETEQHAGSSSTARPAYSVSTEEPAKDQSPASYVNREGRPWMFTLSQPVEEQLGEEELSDDDSQVDVAEDDGGIADISLIDGRLCLHCKRWEREVWLPCGHWFLCGSCFFCPQFWCWHLDDDVPMAICLVCQEPIEDAEIPRLVVIHSRNRRRTGRCSCYQRKG